VNVSCPECSSVFRVDPAKVSAAAIRARCSVCGGVITVGAGRSIDEEFAPASRLDTAPAAPPVMLAPPPSVPALTPPFPQAPAAAQNPSRPSFAPRPTMPPMPAIPPSRPMMPTARPAGAAPTLPVMPPGVSRPFTATPGLPRPVMPPLGTSAPARPSVGASMPPRPSMAAPSSTTPTRAPINPFLANDPNAKARRLSRALISDLVTYFPQRREEGVRDGTLKELFREEIKKSYEEYVDQVGKEFADSTTHFQEALNDILAGGQKMF
jgi:predicted Zn finger-like uncharacterized protein